MNKLKGSEVSQIKVQGSPAAFWEAVLLALVRGRAGVMLLAGLEACTVPFCGFYDLRKVTILSPGENKKGARDKSVQLKDVFCII